MFLLVLAVKRRQLLVVPTQMKLKHHLFLELLLAGLTLFSFTMQELLVIQLMFVLRQNLTRLSRRLQIDVRRPQNMGLYPETFLKQLPALQMLNSSVCHKSRYGFPPALWRGVLYLPPAYCMLDSVCQS